MEKREKIIVALALISACYGALDYFILSSPKKNDPALASSDTNKTIKEIQAKLAALPSDQEINSLVNKIHSPWDNDTFFSYPVEVLFEGEIQKERDSSVLDDFDIASLKYTGFLGMEGKNIAIINGTDYRVSDQIGPFTIAKITPESLTIVYEKESYSIPFIQHDTLGEKSKVLLLKPDKEGN